MFVSLQRDDSRPQTNLERVWGKATLCCSLVAGTSSDVGTCSPTAAPLGAEAGDVSISVDPEGTPVRDFSSGRAWRIAFWTGELAAFAVSSPVTGDFSLSIISGSPGVLPTFWATTASISHFGSNSELARPGIRLASE